MSFSLGGSNKKTNISQTGTMSGTMSGTGASVGTSAVASQTNPWAATTPFLQDYLSRLGTAGASLGTLSPGQSSALTEMAANAGSAGQWTPDIEALTRDLFATKSRAPTVTGAYDTLQRQLTPIATGAVNPMDDPNFRALIDSVGADARNQVSSMFAGAGRDFSAGHAGTVGREVTRATLPILASQYNTNLDRQIGASRALFDAGQSTATTAAGLDAASADQRARGIETAQAALASLNLPAQMRLEIENQLRTLPVAEMGLLAQQLFAAAGLGSSTAGTQTQVSLEQQQQQQQQQQRMSGTQTSSGTQWGLGLRWPSIGA